MSPDDRHVRRCARLLVIDPDEALASSLIRLFAAHGYECAAVPSGAEGLRVAAAAAWDAVLIASELPDGSGLDVLAGILEHDPLCAVVVLSGRDDAQAAVDALRGGALGHLTKPATLERILVAVEQACERRCLRLRVEAASRRDVGPRAALGASPAWRGAMDALLAAARAPHTPVLVSGEPGTGKELAASMLHAWSDRARQPFVSVNAASLAPPLLEIELFGHASDASGGRRGLLELACGGTLFLDEIGELPLELQPKLLRVLEGQPLRRVGSEREIRVDVRVVSATHRDLAEAVSTGRFRPDLYQRLRALEIAMPALRDRGDDVELLALHFVKALSTELGKPGLTLSPDALAALRCHAWPANVRELRNVIERAVVVCRSCEIRPVDLPRDLCAPAEGVPRPLRLDEVIRRHVLEVFDANADNVTRTARALGISRVALRRRLREYGAKPPPS